MVRPLNIKMFRTLGPSIGWSDEGRAGASPERDARPLGVTPIFGEP